MVETVSPANYVPVTTSESKLIDMCEEYCVLCKRVAELTPNALSRQLLVDMSHANPRCRVCTLGLNVKSHKLPGSVKMRGIHCTSVSPFRPAMRWVAHVLQQTLNSLPHLVVNTEDLIAKVSKVQVDSSGRMYKADVKCFFMPGNHRDLVAKCKSILGPELQTVFSDAVAFLLPSQFVKARGEGASRAHPVKVCSGMGVICSGEISDIVLYLLVERDYVLDPYVIQKYQIKLYLRFRDDLLMIAGCGHDLFRECWSGLCVRSSYLKVEADAMSSVSVDVLDATLSKGPHWARVGRLDVGAYFKSSALGMIERQERSSSEYACFVASPSL